MIIWYLILLLFILDLTACFIYSLFRKKWDNKKNIKISSEKTFDEKKNCDSMSYIIFKKIDNYLYGLTWWTSLWVGHIPLKLLRNCIYRYVFRMDLSRNTLIYGRCEIRAPWNISIGNSTIMSQAILDGRKGITIGHNVVFGTGVWLWTDQHNADDPYFRCLNSGGPIIIEDRAWICSRTTILPNTQIGKGAVIASGALVTKDCLEFTMYGGVPAKKIKDRNPNLLYENVTECKYPFF